jgi:putative methionine-R-sulfoxide reductase with GAF domain
MKEIPQQNTKYSRLKKQLNDLCADYEKLHAYKSKIHRFLLKLIRKLFDAILYLYRMSEP